MSTELSPSGKVRYEFLDAARGLAILLMVVHHFFYDLMCYCGFPAKIFYHPVVTTVQFFFQCLFIAMSGATCAFSRSLVKRGLRIAAAAVIVTLATYIFDPTYYVRFGILHFLAAASLLYCLIKPLIDHLDWNPIVWAVLFAVSYIALDRTFDIPHLWALGIRDASFRSSDYFPILPWFFVYLAGVWFGKRVKNGVLPQWFYDFKQPFLAAVGKQALWIYLLHQPVLMGITQLILLIKG